jgi:N-acetylmuramoyl-L-alanine amidase
MGKRKIICIDAGHGGDDPGTVRGIIEEEDLTLDLADRIGRNIRLLSRVSDIEAYSQISTLFTRRTDINTPINARTIVARRNQVDLLLSIHINSAKQISDGALCIISKDGDYQDRSRKVAEKILDRLEECGLKNRGVFPDKKPYINYNRLGVLYGVCQYMPAVLVEMGNIRNDQDYKLLTSTQGREVMAIAVARSIIEWYGLEPRMDLLG